MELHNTLHATCASIDGAVWRLIDKSESLHCVGMTQLANDLESISQLLRKATEEILSAYSADLSGQLREQEQGMGRILGAILDRAEDVPK